MTDVKGKRVMISSTDLLQYIPHFSFCVEIERVELKPNRAREKYRVLCVGGVLGVFIE